MIFHNSVQKISISYNSLQGPNDWFGRTVQPHHQISLKAPTQICTLGSAGRNMIPSTRQKVNLQTFQGMVSFRELL